jgi:Trk K+ transport system NAD-binding subunit
MRTLIIGSGRVGRVLAERLENRGEFVVIVDDDEKQIERARGQGFTVVAGDGTEPDVLREAGIEDTKRVIAATQNDNDNLLICQIAKSKFDIEHVLSRVNRPENMDAFETLGVTAIDSPTATATAIDDEIERPALSHWMSQIGDGHDVQEIEVTASDLIGRTIREVNADIPDGCIVAVIGRGGDSHVPDADDKLEYGDHITFIGEEKAVRRAMKRFHPHD